MTQRKQWSWITGIGLSAALALAGCGSEQQASSADLASSSAAQTLAGSTFESSDGDFVASSGAEDWASFTVSQIVAAGGAVKDDIVNSQSDNAFGQGTKEDDLSPTVKLGSIPPNKSDLRRFYLYPEEKQLQDGVHHFVYLAWERTNVLGSANMDFELNQLPQPDLTTNGTKSLNRMEGDILITFDFTNGGSTASVNVLRWVTSGATSQCEASNALPCWGNKVKASDLGEANGAVNSTTVTDPNSGVSLAANEFGEAGVDLTAAGIFPIAPTTCTSFSSVYLKSRASASFTAEIKDLVPPAHITITNCGSILIQKSFTGVTSEPFPVATFTAYRLGTIDPTDATKCVGTPTSSCNTLATTTSAGAAGTCTIDGLLADSYCVAETSTPTGFFTANAQVKSVPVDTQVTYTFVDAPKRTLQIVKKDDAGNNVSGAAFALCSGTVNALCASPVGTCSTGSSNTCSIGNLVLGNYTLFETTVPSGYSSGIPSTGLPVNIAQGDADPKVVTVNNPRQFRIITLVCVEATNALYSSSVTQGGVTRSSIGAAALPAGVTEATLCGIGGARFTGLSTGTFSDNIVIGTSPVP
jgi:hypothetical protein